MRITNTHFLQQLLTALIALTISAAILIPGFLVLYPELNPDIDNTTNTRQVYNRTIGGSDWHVALGSGTLTEDNSLEVIELDKNQGKAMLARSMVLRTDDYPFLEYEIKNRHPGTSIFFIWLTADEPEKVFSTQILGNGSEVNTVNLVNIKDWKGQIQQIGLGVYGDLRDQPLTISSVTLKPYSMHTLAKAIWSEWTVFQGWSQASINNLRSTPENPVISSTVAAAAWTGLALFILASAYLVTRAKLLVSYGAAILIPWIALDILWQYELSARLEDTRNLFAGKTQSEKQLSEKDSEIYEYAQYLKEKVLPKPGVRIFLLHDDDLATDGHNFQRLRAQFHLLPHNIFNYGRVPYKPNTHRGDYILTLGEFEELSFQPAQGTLNWSEDSYLAVTLIDQHPLGNLYLVSGDAID